ncbi:MAG: hypothetical protein H6623_03565 [Bdellovibrionaceae bacterium]|nr:hypothetical protein [Pseudobdellovibrionaceae bacterium]
MGYIKELVKKIDIPVYLRILSVFYFLGFLLHLMDVFGWRLELTRLHPFWTTWVWFLLVADLITALLLIWAPLLGVIGFHVVALAQLFAYIIYQEFFGRQDALVLFHVISLVFYWKLYARKKRAEFDGSKEKSR